ncbi:MAG: ribosome recycling factor [Candidatus Izemoplasmatales bacterium]|jgi:ribosome recycling factor|nr:ribosome recycling factor [Candidatus Izemoplasmatales bacterium]MDD4355596.1 ribosome recycling factor [Candidatus Izemoplasmatales bacterium]MDD4987659.1 ribosome recycling factor [Candidatus Izemoplasmatales bacterium]MDD5602083.1 ribosome recycling factor [Candidatus Izemoplasmatales bacterium]
MPETILLNAEERMEQALHALHKEFSTVRSGRANPKMFERVSVDYYGVLSPINQVASIQVPEANQIYIKPYDKSLVQKIERAIFAANLGVTPTNDGVGVRISLPPLTEENRRDSVKAIHRMSEDNKIAIRNIRRDAIADLKKMEKDKSLTEDDLRFYQDEAQKLTDKFIEKIDEAFREKENDIMSL